MVKQAKPTVVHQDPSRTSALALLKWWDTLPEDDRDLLRLTYDAIPENQPALAWLAWTGCPLIESTPRASEPYQLVNAPLMQAFLAQM